MAVVGECKLCLRPAMKLQESHFLSAGIYKKLRDTNEKNPNPWMITEKNAVQISKQQKAYLLCSDCEERFSKHGENWVLAHCLRADGRFPLAEILASKVPALSSPSSPTRVYNSASIHEINISALAYFATSIFWRGSIHGWNGDGSIPVNLGELKEQFRVYLTNADLKVFPQDCALWVIVREGQEISRLTHPPVGGRQGNFHNYRFPMPGLGFVLAVGKNISANDREKCFVRGRGNPIIVTSLLERFLMDGAVRMLGRALSGRKSIPKRVGRGT
jgi:hypothetical protein